MLDSLEGYLDNAAAAATKTVSKGGPIAELAANLAISVDTIAWQQQEIKCLYKQINALKKRGNQYSSVRKLEEWGMVGNICTHCEAVSRTAPHRNNACYFDLRNMTDWKEWAWKLMDEKGVACKDYELWCGTAQRVVHIYPLKEPLFYEASLICSPTLRYITTPDAPQRHIIPQQDTGVVESGATHLYIDPSAPHGTPDTSAATISVGTLNGQVEN